MRDRQRALAEAAQREEDARRRRDEMDAAYHTYLEEDPVLPAFSEERPEADIAPLPIAEETVPLPHEAARSPKIFYLKETHQ